MTNDSITAHRAEQAVLNLIRYMHSHKHLRATCTTGDFSAAILCLTVLAPVIVLSDPTPMNFLRYPLKNEMPIIFLGRKIRQSYWLSPCRPRPQPFPSYSQRSLSLACGFTENDLKLHLLLPNHSTNMLPQMLMGLHMAWPHDSILLKERESNSDSDS